MRFPARIAATKAIQSEGLPLLREWIHEVLYLPGTGYFTRRDNLPPVGSIGRPINFAKLWGKQEYDQAVHALYQNLQVAWITPSELFSPAYGQGIAACISQHHASRPSSPLDIVEIGGGNGTLAADIMNSLRATDSELYQQCTYRSLEISPSLAELQRQRLRTDGHSAQRFSVTNADARHAAAWGASPGHMTYVVMCEVLDNLPHDRITLASNGQWQQTHVKDGTQEVLAPLTDPLIVECMDLLEHLLYPQRPSGFLGSFSLHLLERAMGVGKSMDTFFIPTGALQFLHTLQHVRPQHMIIAADFDQLPDVKIAGTNAPLVSQTVGGTAHDRLSYLRTPGQDRELDNCDIFFPTDFSWLSALFGSRSPMGMQKTSHVMKSTAFALAFSDVMATRCADGFNPQLEDFTNTSFFLGSSLKGHAPPDAFLQQMKSSKKSASSWYSI